jgi:hypothetical protein
MTEKPPDGTLYVDYTINKWWQYCPVHGWVDVTDLYGDYDSKLFEEHKDCDAVQRSGET